MDPKALTQELEELGLLGELETARRRKRIIELYTEGYTNAEIAAAVNSTPDKIGPYIGRLLRRGWMERIERPRPPAHRPRKLEDDPRGQYIVKRIREMATLNQIGRELGISGSRVGQLRDRIAERYGQAIFSPASEDSKTCD